MSILRTAAIATILIGAAAILYVAVDGKSGFGTTSRPEFPETRESGIRMASPGVAFTVQTRELVDAPVFGPSRAAELPDDLLSVPPPPPEMLRDAEAALSGVKEVILASPSGSLRLESEPVDPNWAPQMEATIWGIAAVAGEVRDVQCRTTYCRAALQPLESESVEGIPNDQELVPNQRVLTEVFESIIRNSNGRLASFSIDRPPPFNDQQRDGEIVVILSGRPIE